jgi:hypothetical protein
MSFQPPFKSFQPNITPSISVCTPTPVVQACYTYTPTGQYGSVCVNTGVVSTCFSAPIIVPIIPVWTPQMNTKAVTGFNFLANNCNR